MQTKELQGEIVSNMRKWQKIENATATSTANIMEKTDNPVVRLIMEIIQQDSRMHYRVQEFIADSIEHKAIRLTPDELIQVWEMIEQHMQLELKSIELAEQALKSTRRQQGMIIPDYLINYLLQDEKKHSDLLKNMADIKKGIYRSV